MSQPQPQSHPNIYILASDNSPTLLPLLRTNPSLATSQDAHGYSLLHAAASWNHTTLLRALVHEFHVDVNMTDEDGDTCLFTAESLEVARCLVEELGIDTSIKNSEGQTAGEAIAAEGTFPEVAAYLTGTTQHQGDTLEEANARAPENMRVDVRAVSEEALGGGGEPDPEMRRRIEELAGSERFHSEEGQRELRGLVAEALGGLRGEGEGEREAKRRAE